MKVEFRSSNGASVIEAPSGERLLYAGLRTGLGLPYECASGTCGTCRARVVEGEVECLWPEAPGHRSVDAAKGEVLLCQCAARTAAVLEVKQAVKDISAERPLPAWGRGTIVRSESLTGDVMSMTVALTAPVSFEAGQFYLVERPDVQGARAYSMVNYDPQTSELEFVIKKKPQGGFTEALFADTGVGVEVEVYGPLGSATFQPTMDQSLVCIAGGTGIAGILSILDHACAEGYFDKHEGHVFFGVRTPADVFYLDRLSAYRERFPSRLNIAVALSDQAPDEQLRARYPGIHFGSGFVHEVAKASLAGGLAGSMAYVAGPPPAVDAAIRFLIMSGVSAGNIRYDKFN
jgi:toluene monooxygenase electron transfer component